MKPICVGGHAGSEWGDRLGLSEEGLAPSSRMSGSYPEGIGEPKEVLMVFKQWGVPIRFIKVTAV